MYICRRLLQARDTLSEYTGVLTVAKVHEGVESQALEPCLKSASRRQVGQARNHRHAGYHDSMVGAHVLLDLEHAPELTIVPVKVLKIQFRAAEQGGEPIFSNINCLKKKIQQVGLHPC